MWRSLSERHGLIKPDLSSLVGWALGEFIFNTETDVISDVNKMYAHGFQERMDSTASLLGVIDRLKRQRVLPETKKV